MTAALPEAPPGNDTNPDWAAHMEKHVATVKADLAKAEQDVARCKAELGVLGVEQAAGDVPEVMADPAPIAVARAALESADVDTARKALSAIDDAVNAPDVRQRRAERLVRQAAGALATLDAAPTVDATERAVATASAMLDSAERLIATPRRTLADVMSGAPKPVPWLCPGLQIVRGRPAMVIGYPGAGKTYAQVSAATAWALDEPAWGCPDFRAVRPLRVLYVDVDMGAEAAEERLRATAFGLGLSPAEVRDVGDVVVVEGDVEPLRLASHSPEDVGAMRRAWARAVRGFDLVIVDSYRGVLLGSGIDENAAAAAVVAVQWARVSNETGVAFWACRHAGKDPSDGKNRRSPEQVGSGSAAIDGASGSKLVMQLDPKLDREQALQAPRHVGMVRDAARLGSRPYQPHYLALEQGETAGEAWVRCLYRTVEQVHPPDVIQAADAAGRCAALDHVARAEATGAPFSSMTALSKALGLRKADALAMARGLREARLVTATDPVRLTDDGRAYFAHHGRLGA